MNGDGRLDIATANFSNGTVSLLLATATGTFGPATALSMGSATWDVALVDLNGDGRLDAITANQNSNNITVRLGNRERHLRQLGCLLHRRQRPADGRRSAT